MSSDNTQTSRIWFVTGASSGFGRAVCADALARGDTVIAASRRPEAIMAGDGRISAVRLDVTDPAAVTEAVQNVVERHGRLDVVFNNAGYGHVGAAEELSEDDLRRQFEVNLFGVINVTRAALPHMRRQRSGHLLQMSSLNGIEGLAGGSYYAASKFAIEGFSESLAEEVAPLGIKVTIVEPGPHRTGFLSARSARFSTPIDDYAQTAGQARELLSQLDGSQPGDPVRAARAIMRSVDSSRPPLRLPLGRMAVDHIRSRLERQLQELDAIADLSASSEFPD